MSEHTEHTDAEHTYEPPPPVHVPDLVGTRMEVVDPWADTIHGALARHGTVTAVAPSLDDQSVDTITMNCDDGVTRTFLRHELRPVYPAPPPTPPVP